ncbi:MAG: dihydroneopterin aldolase [Marinosulfonomonas sp.]|nr:dihydroneopterin aldolase [Marinosulfonomonas sp.]
MTNDTKLAFEHPVARAKATCGCGFNDRISLRDHITEVEIGAFQVERGTTQRLQFDVVVEVGAADIPLDDDVDRILSYDTLAEAIAHELAAERLNLLETLADRVAARILHEPQAMRVFVRIQKLDRGPGALGVEIVRSRDGDMGDTVDEAPLHPVIVYMENAAITGAALARWIDRIERLDAPVILCVGLPDVTSPQTGHAPTQRRIDLLEIEQNAWMLASRDPRCVVVDSRTELDWAMKQGKLSVWAPSRIVLDAHDGPAAGADGLALAKWLGEVLEADRLVVIGATGKDAFAPDAPETFE